MKKVLFIAVAALAFAACGNSTNTEEQPVEATPVETVVETPAVDSTATPAADSTATPAATPVK
ncbi:MAG: hypothetical protein RR555_09375 [Bacteroidales bacterium]